MDISFPKKTLDIHVEVFHLFFLNIGFGTALSATTCFCDCITNSSGSQAFSWFTILHSGFTFTLLVCWLNSHFPRPVAVAVKWHTRRYSSSSFCCLSEELKQSFWGWTNPLVVPPAWSRRLKNTTTLEPGRDCGNSLGVKIPPAIQFWRTFLCTGWRKGKQSRKFIDRLS